VKYLSIIIIFICGCASYNEGYEYQPYQPEDPCPTMTSACSGCAFVCDKLSEMEACYIYDSAQACCPRDYRHCMAACMGGSCYYTYEYIGQFDCRGMVVYGECE